VFLSVVILAVEPVLIVSKAGYTFPVSPSVAENLFVGTFVRGLVLKVAHLVRRNVRLCAHINDARQNAANHVKIVRTLVIVVANTGSAQKGVVKSVMDCPVQRIVQ
jgi:hypothetical protein